MDPFVGYRIDIYCSNPARKVRKSDNVTYRSWTQALTARSDMVQRYINRGWIVAEIPSNNIHDYILLKGESMEKDGTCDYVLMRLIATLCHKQNSIIALK